MGMEVSSPDTMVIDTRDTQDTEYGIDITVDTLDTGDIQSTRYTRDTLDTSATQGTRYTTDTMNIRYH